MKVIDVLKHKDFQLNSNLINQSSIRVSEDEIDAKLTVALDINEEIDCNYYQYDHMYRTINPRVLGTITLSITTHNLTETQKNDNIKNEYCKTNNIPLVRIPYWERDNITLEMLLGKEYLVE